MMRTVFLLLLIGALCCGSARAAKFYTIGGQVIAGDLQSVDAAGTMEVKSDPAGAPQKLAGEDLMRIEFAEDREPEELADGVVVYLPGEDRICGVLAKSSQSAVEVQTKSFGRLTLPLEKLLAIEFRRLGERPKDAAAMQAQLLANDTKNDITFSANGDQMAGILVGFDGDQVVLKTSAGDMPVKTARLFGVSFAARKRPPPPPSLLAVARCADGSVVTGSLRGTRSGGIKLALLAGPEVEIPEAALVDVTFKQGRLVYLSDLSPETETYTPFFGGDRTWPWQRDRNYDHGPIRLAGKTYRKGLGTFSGTKLAYNLGGEFKKFEAQVGIDDADTNHQGDVTVRVLADGKPVFEKAGITQKSGPVKIELSTAGVKTLELVVDFGENMHFGDFTDWADARLIR